MVGFLTLKQLFDNILATKFVKDIYHSVALQPELKGKGNTPAAPVNGRYIYVGVDDTKGFSCYCRQTGPLEVIKSEALGGCGIKKYKTQVPHRLVFFNMNEKRTHEEVFSVLLSAVIKTPKVILSKANMNREEVLRLESPSGKFNFKPSTFYIGIDFVVLLDIQADNCSTEINCDNLKNPYCGSTE